MGRNGCQDANNSVRPLTGTAPLEPAFAINASTRLFPIIGAPVAGVFSPPAFNAWFRKHNLDFRMVALEVPPDGLSAFLEFLRHSPSLIGCSVTYPHKQMAFDAVDYKTDRAARLGALNTIRREADGSLTGDATDGAAMCAAISAAGGSIAGATARILGAGGGAGQAIADAFCSAGIGRIQLLELDADRQKQVVRNCRDHWPDVDIDSTSALADILVNATILGKTQSDPSPFTEADISAAKIVCDVVTGDMTPLTKNATRQGKITVSGADMGSGQLPSQLAFLGLL